MNCRPACVVLAESGVPGGKGNAPRAELREEVKLACASSVGNKFARVIPYCARASITRSAAMRTSKFFSSAVSTYCFNVASWKRSNHFLSAIDSVPPVAGASGNCAGRLAAGR